MSNANFKEGTILKVDGGSDGLTKMEREFQAGTLDLSKYETVITPELREVLEAEAKKLMDAGTDSAIKRTVDIKPNIAAPVTMNDLSESERARVM